MKNRYYFAKKLYPEYLVLVIKDKKYYSFESDKKILNYIGFNNKLSVLRNKKINFVVLDDLEIIGMATYDDNNYKKYLYLSGMKDVVTEMKRSLNKCSILL